MECNQIVVPSDWRKKLDVRAQSRQLLQHGILIKQPCQLCFQESTVMAHLDYENPYHVTWFCKKHYQFFRKLRREEGKS